MQRTSCTDICLLASPSHCGIGLRCHRCYLGSLLAPLSALGNLPLVHLIMSQVPVQAYPWLRALSRLNILAVITAIAYTGRNFLGAVESVAGAFCALQCSLLLPITFYIALKVKRKRMQLQEWVGLGSMLVFGAMLVVLIVVQAIRGVGIGRRQAMTVVTMFPLPQAA